jgi:hypothetical protein
MWAVCQICKWRFRVNWQDSNMLRVKCTRPGCLGEAVIELAPHQM